MEQTPIIEMKDISKHFGGIHALQEVTIDLYEGEILGIVGHNGAGKSTLIKILSVTGALFTAPIPVAGLLPSRKGLMQG